MNIIKLITTLALALLTACGQSGEPPYSFKVADAPKANTGLTYDPVRNLLVHSIYGEASSSQLLYTDFKGKKIDALDITPLIDHIQGVTYNFDNDTFYIWGTKKGVTHVPFSTNLEIIEVNRDGVLISRITPPEVYNYAGSLAYQGNNTLWIKANNRTTIALLDMKTGQIVEEFDTKIAGEGIAITENNNFLLHDGEFVYKLNRTGEILATLKSPTVKGESEDIVSSYNGYIWISADEERHGNVKDGNRVWQLIESQLKPLNPKESL